MNGARYLELLVLNLCAGAVALSVLAACSMDVKTKPVALPSKSIGVNASQSDNANPVEPTPQGTVAAEPTVVGPESLTMNLIDLSAGGRQRKSSEQLQSSYLSCVGSQAEGDSNSPDNSNPSILKINSGMIVASDSSAKPKGRFGFLIVSKPEDVLEKSALAIEKSFIDINGTTSGVDASSLDDELYLNSLQNVASVIAYNCDVENDSSQCFCATKEKAKAMVERCLPLFEPSSEEFEAAYQGFSEACSADASDEGLFKRRQAIVSLLSSYAFATSK